MSYLKDYNLSDEDLQEIYDNLSDEEWILITGSSSKIKEILDYLTSLGITNVKDMFLYKMNIFYQHADDLENYIKKSEIPDIIDKLKESVLNFDLLGL